MQEVQLSPMAVNVMAAAVPLLLAVSSYLMHPLAGLIGAPLCPAHISLFWKQALQCLSRLWVLDSCYPSPPRWHCGMSCPFGDYPADV